MSCRAKRSRTAFSLLEVIIAMAILAGSAMVLFSLIGMGTKYGNRAEQRTIALTQTQSLLDEFIARMPNEERRDEVTGVLPGSPPRSFRIEVSPFELTGKEGANRSASLNGEVSSGLYRVTVKLFESSTKLSGAEGEPLLELSQLVRRPGNDPATNGHVGGEGTNSIEDRSVNPGVPGIRPR